MTDDQPKRWVVDALQGHVIPSMTGSLVFFYDHVAAVARLTRERDEARDEVERLRNALAVLGAHDGCDPQTGACGDCPVCSALSTDEEG
jgi:hypothetical protein